MRYINDISAFILDIEDKHLGYKRRAFHLKSVENPTLFTKRN